VRLTVFEHGELRVGRAAVAGVDAFDHEAATAIVELSARMGARALSWIAPDRLRAQQFVGVLQAGDIQVEILPKLDDVSNTEGIRRNLLAMLAVAHDLEVRESDWTGFLQSTEPFISALARLYCRRLLEVVRRGLRQDYVARFDVLPHVRGKIDWPRQARSEASLRLEFNCLFDERSENTLLNRALKAALVRSARLLEGSRDISVVTELRHAMSEVADSCPLADELQRLRTDRTSHRLKPLLTLAKLILGNTNPDLGRSAQGEHRTYAVVWDMNVLFEEYIGRLTRSVLAPKGLVVDLQQGASVYLAKDRLGQRQAFLLRPDILVRRGRQVAVIADTKWKRLDPWDTHLGVKGGDVYQVMAYAHRYTTECAALVFPHNPAIGTPGVQREFVTHGQSPAAVRVRVLTVDLSRLSSVPAQLEQGLLGDKFGTAASVEAC
jgi:5-methylcytosine-specific restriction enzyme subunit McrC